jgi:[amino group carrier protein]-lysine/ornithine hydrolase
MSTSDPTELLREMVEISSVTGAEAELTRHLVRRLPDFGLAARVDEVGNVLAESGSDGAGVPFVLMVGHLDTVPGDIPVRLEDRTLHGRGTVDAKGPLAAMFCAAARLRTEFPARLLVVGAVDEEGGSRGAHALLDRYRPDAVVIGEPSGVDGVTLGYRGILRLRYEVSRPRTHTSGPDLNATELAAEFWQAVRAELDHESDGPRFHQAAPALVGFTGDVVGAALDISCRLPPGFDADGLLHRLRAHSGDGTVTVVEHVPATSSRRTDLVAQSLASAIRRHGRTVRYVHKLGTSDMNVLRGRWPVPMAAYGPGDSRLDHRDDERIDLDEFLAAVDILTTSVRELSARLRRSRRTPAGAGV